MAQTSSGSNLQIVSVGLIILAGTASLMLEHTVRYDSVLDKRVSKCAALKRTSSR